MGTFARRLPAPRRGCTVARPDGPPHGRGD